MGSGESTTRGPLGPLDACLSPRVANNSKGGGGFSSAPVHVELCLADKERWMLNINDRSRNSIETFEDRAARYIRELTVPVDRLRVMVDAFVHELEIGLTRHRENPHEFNPKLCSFKMLDACIPNPPSGTEKGIFYALDFGGTNFRTVRVELQGSGEMLTEQAKATLTVPTPSLPKGLLDKHATATQMFDFFATNVKKFMQEQGDLERSREEMTAGFTFSFPCDQRRLDSAFHIDWTKGFETGRATNDPVERLDVVELMNVAFQRNEVPLACNSVLNDTVGTLLSCAYEMQKSTSKEESKSQHTPPCLVGMILGTGVNCCYVDDQAPYYGYKGKIINIECGNFNRELPQTNVDCELDFISVDNRGAQRLEKMISGAYIGEIARQCLVKIFQFKLGAQAWRPESLSAEVVAIIVGDRSSQMAQVRKSISSCWDQEFSPAEYEIIYNVCSAVLDRSAALAAMMIAGCAKKTQRLQPAMGGLTVGIDGSLYTRNQKYGERIRYYLNEILGEKTARLIHLRTADDGSGKGAAILSAVAAAEENSRRNKRSSN